MKTEALAGLQTKSDVMNFCVLDDTWEAFRWPSVAELSGVRVIVSTCIATGFFLRTADSPFRCPFPVSHVLIDEAGQAPLPEALLPMCMADPITGSCILAGTSQCFFF